MPNWYLGSSALVRFMTWSRFHRANKPQSLNPFDLLRFIHPCLKSFDSPTATYGVLYTSVFTVLAGRVTSLIQAMPQLSAEPEIRSPGSTVKRGTGSAAEPVREFYCDGLL
jgi:hypothetical protein